MESDKRGDFSQPSQLLFFFFCVPTPASEFILDVAAHPACLHARLTPDSKSPTKARLSPIDRVLGVTQVVCRRLALTQTALNGRPSAWKAETRLDAARCSAPAMQRKTWLTCAASDAATPIARSGLRTEMPRA